MLYFAQVRQFTKIGVSGIPKRRIKSMQVSNPFEIELVATFDIGSNSRRAERRLHSKLEDCNVRGEWFKIDEGNIPIIMKVLRGYNIDLDDKLGEIAVVDEDGGEIIDEEELEKPTFHKWWLDLRKRVKREADEEDKAEVAKLVDKYHVLAESYKEVERENRQLKEQIEEVEGIL